MGKILQARDGKVAGGAAVYSFIPAVEMQRRLGVRDYRDGGGSWLVATTLDASTPGVERRPRRQWRGRGRE